MAHKKRKKIHKCTNHNNKRARGRCAVCGKWLCNDCLEFKGGKFYCAGGCDTASSNELIFSANQSRSQIPTVDEQVKKLNAVVVNKKVESVVSSQKNRRLMVLTPLLLAVIAALVFTILLLVKENRSLTDDVVKLREKSVVLKKLIIKRNRYIRKLKGDTLSDTTVKNDYENIDHKKLSKSPPAGIFKSSGRSYSYSRGKIPLTFDNGSTSKKLIALTFDGGSHKKAADEILRTLKEKNVKVTLFFTGEFIRRNGDLIKRVLSEGHEVGNHTYSHPHLTAWGDTHIHSTLSTINESVIRSQLIRTNELYKKITGENMIPLWRSPYGERNSQINRWALETGYLHIGWKQARSWWLNYDTNDWVPDSDTPGYYTGEQVVEKFKKLSVLKPNGMNGAIILMHLGTIRKNKNEQVHKYLGEIIDNLRNEGYRFVKVTEMISEAGIDLSKLKWEN